MQLLTELLPSVGRIVHGATNRERNCHSKVSEILQRTETKDILELLYAVLVSTPDELVNLINDVDNPGNAIRRAKFYDGIVPLRILEQSLDSGTASDTSSKHIVVRLHGECGVSTSEGTAVHDPWGVGTAQTGVDAWEGSMLSEIGIIGNSYSASEYKAV